MTLTEKKDLYNSKFPSILADRMVEQMDQYSSAAEYHRPKDLIMWWKNWDTTKEGYNFWSDLYDLYDREVSPTTEQILEVFRKFNIQTDQP